MQKNYSSNKKIMICVTNLTTFFVRQVESIIFTAKEITTKMKDHGC